MYKILKNLIKNLIKNKNLNKHLDDNSDAVNKIVYSILKDFKKYEENKETIKIISNDNSKKENINIKRQKINLYKKNNKKIFNRICLGLSNLEYFIKNIKYNEIRENDLKQIQFIIDKINCKNNFKKFDIKKIVNCTSCAKYNDLILKKENEYCKSKNKLDIQEELKILDSLKIKHCKELCNTCIKLLENYDKVLDSKEKGSARDIQKTIKDIMNNISNSSECKNSYKICNDLDGKIKNSNNNDYKKMLKQQSMSLDCNKILDSRYYNEDEEKVYEEIIPPIPNEVPPLTPKQLDNLGQSKPKCDTIKLEKTCNNQRVDKDKVCFWKDNKCYQNKIQEDVFDNFTQDNKLTDSSKNSEKKNNLFSKHTIKNSEKINKLFSKNIIENSEKINKLFSKNIIENPKEKEELEKELSELDSSFQMDDFDLENIIDEAWAQIEKEEEYTNLLEKIKTKNPEYFKNKKIKRKIKNYCKKNSCDIDEIINTMKNMKISKKELENNTDKYLTEIFEKMKL